MLPHEISVLTFSAIPGIAVGDKIKISGDTNNIRNVVVASTQGGVKCNRYKRPSRSYAKHVRRIKQNAAAR